MDLNEFAEKLYGDATDGWLTLNFFPAKDTAWFQVGSQPPEIRRKRNLYLGLGIRGNRVDGRGTYEDIIGIPGLWLDLDYESDEGSHKTTARLPPDEAAALSLLEAAPHPPTLVVNSGHGLQAYWLFNEVWYFDSSEDRDRASRLNKGWQSWFQDQAALRGWHVDSAADLTRVFRVPGSQNYKVKPYREVRVLSEYPLRYEPSDFETWMEPMSQAAHQATALKRTQNGQFKLTDIAHLSDRVKYLILHGDSLRRYPSRSEAVFAAINGLIGAGCDDQEIAQILMDTEHRISELPREKGERWLDQEITRAHQKAKEPQYGVLTEEWREKLLVKKNGDPTVNHHNIGLFLEHCEEWRQKFWWDSVRGLQMIGNVELTEEMTVEIAKWLGANERLAISNLKPLKECIFAECRKVQRDLLQEHLAALPKWDGKKRLASWLSDVTLCPMDPYTSEVSRVLPMAMVARVLEPGCRYRYVIILEGPEESGKTSLVQALAGQEWYVDIQIGLESKESHMMVQGAWIAEFAELDSFSRTEETRLKAFITETHDKWIPKYSNVRVSIPRRTIFVGTTNDKSYLKGLSGNTRFLPIRTGKHIRTDIFHEIRGQILAEAKHEYLKSPRDWWRLSDTALNMAVEEREERRVHNVYEEDLKEWLEHEKEPPRDTTSWREIADGFLRIDRSQWKDYGLQRQIAQALRAIGYESKVIKEGKRTCKKWVKSDGS